MSTLVPVSYREPFAYGKRPWHDVRPHGESVLEIVRSVPSLPEKFLSRGVVCINGEIVPRELWSYIRPKPASEHLPIAVTLHWPLHDGSRGGSGKSVVAIVAAIALIAITAFIAGPFGAGLLAEVGLTGSFLGITAAQLVAGAVGIAGSLAIAALTRPPSVDPASQTGTDVNADNKDPAAAGGNVLAPGGSVPRIIGTRKVFPPLVTFPEVEQINDTSEQVSLVFALNGPHDISDIQVDGVSITSATDITYELKNGALADTALTTITRQGKMILPQINLSQHILDSEDQFLATGNTTTEVPQWHRFVTNESPDEVFIQLLLPGGLAVGGTGNQNTAFPFRMRCREVGDVTWINFPEFHLQGNNFRQTRRQIRLRWDTSDVGTQPIPTVNGWYYLRNNPPAQTKIPPSPTAWVADSHFDSGTGNDYVYFGTETTTRIKNYNVSSNWNLDFIMTGLPQGKYEIEIQRGCAYFLFGFPAFDKASYSYGGDAIDFFWVTSLAGQYYAPQDQTNFVTQCTLMRCVSIWHDHPIAGGQGKFALLAIKATNRNIQRVSMLASGLVGTWNGSDWTTVVAASSNPAAHYRDVLLGLQNHDPLDSTLVDNTGLIDWYTECASNDWTCDAIIDDMRTQDVLDLLASCGYARPYQSDQYGVIVDDDRSGDSPVQVFSRINTSSMKFDKAFTKAPAGIIISYHDSDIDYEQNQEIVNQTDPSVGTTGLYETISYDGLVDAAHVAARGKFDLDQANLRSTFYSFDCDIESIICRRGDLVAIQHDILETRAWDAHIKTVLTSGGNITGLVLDSQIPVLTASVGIAIRRSGGAITTHQIVSVLGYTDTVTFTTPFAIPPGNTIVGYDDTNDEYGCLIVSGDLTTVYRRMLVHTIAPTKDLKASITLVDEAQALVRF